MSQQQDARGHARDAADRYVRACREHATVLTLAQNGLASPLAPADSRRGQIQAHGALLEAEFWLIEEGLHQEARSLHADALARASEAEQQAAVEALESLKVAP